MNEILETKKKDQFLVDPRNIIVDYETNGRLIYPDIDELAQSILENGLETALKVKRDSKDTEKFHLIEGFRRMTAINKLLAGGKDIGRVACTVEAKGCTSEQRLINRILSNSGVRYTGIEEGFVFLQLKKHGYTIDEIHKKIGKSKPYIYNMVAVAESPKEVQQQIIDGKISESTVVQIFSMEESESERIKLVNDAVNNAESLGKKRKATLKNLSGGKSKSPHQILTEVYECVLDEDSKKAEIFRTIFEMAKRKYSVQEIINELI